MAMSKIDRIDREIEKTRGKITEFQNKLKELEAQRTEQENFEIILLSYFLDMSDNEIAKLLNMVRSSVAYRRTSTLKLLKELMGGNTDDT